MNFGSKPIPERLFELARQRLLAGPACTPGDIREHLLKKGAGELRATDSIELNHIVIANRVFGAVRDELRAKGLIAPLKRGVWAATRQASTKS